MASVDDIIESVANSMSPPRNEVISESVDAGVDQLIDDIINETIAANIGKEKVVDISKTTEEGNSIKLKIKFCKEAIVEDNDDEDICDDTSYDGGSDNSFSDNTDILAQAISDND